ncbi:hypothetical protein [Sphingobium sp. B2]|uniref:hypothetical protein n=1 Tax=Sphingobium sp. B2 TaxID=2583228 RepID=UPI0011A340B9|nr:hypothetical protein [Sphingobium sp. B2]
MRLTFGSNPLINGIGCILGFVLLPAFIILKLIMMPFEKGAHRSPTYVARYIRDFIDNTSGEWDWDDFISIPVADPRLEAIRAAACDVSLPCGDEELAELEVLFEEAQRLAQQNRAALIAMLSRAIAGGVIDRNELDETFPHPRSLEKIERAAWSALSQWIDDADIRDHGERYRKFRLEQLVGHRERLE